MLANDDMIVNWWNMLQLDHRRIWWGSKTIDLEQKLYDDEIITEYWRWWETPMGMEACRGFHSDLLKRFAEEATTGNVSEILSTYLYNCDHEPCCPKGWSDFLYIPAIFKTNFIYLAKLAYSNQLFLELAVPTIIISLDEIKNFEKVNGLYLFEKEILYFDTKTFWEQYSYNLTFIHPFKLGMNPKNRKLNQKLLKKYVINHTKHLLS